jgi:uncharacterized protein YcgI (DUF1989 family)
MARKLVNEILVPASYGRAWELPKGLIMRITTPEGPQAGDLALYNAHNYKDNYDPYLTYGLACYRGEGNYHHVKRLYSRPPGGNLMLEVLEDTCKRHWILCGGRCNKRSYERNGVTYDGRSCQDNIAESIVPYGMTSEDVCEVFNLWMNVEYTPDGVHNTLPSLSQKGDYIEFISHMDLLCAMSACPASSISSINAGTNKPLKVDIYEEVS